MTQHVADRIAAATEAIGSVACVGLDPRPDLIPPHLAEAAVRQMDDARQAVTAAFLEFNRGVIDAIAGHCVAVKPQAACYEAYGPAGWSCLEATIAHARQRGLTVILDAKRGDIGSTSTHYREAAFGGAAGLNGRPLPGLGADWLTVNPYLGRDAIEPMMAEQPGGHGLFVLVRTSNPGSEDVQSAALSGDETVADRVADLVDRWGSSRRGPRGLSDIGAVVGATWPELATCLRTRMPNTPFLVPGFGAQGAAASDAVAGARPSGDGILVSASRSILGAWDDAGADHDYADSIRAALDRMNEELNAAR